MRYFIRTVLGLGLMVAAIFSAGYAVNQMLAVGTCASGGPYVSARPCPDGALALGLAIPGSVFVMLFGAVLYATRGTAPGGRNPGDGGVVFLIIWSGLFLSIGVACLLGVWGPEANPGPGGKEGGLIVGFLFIPMGLAGLIPLWGIVKSIRAAAEASPVGLKDAMKLARTARKTDFGDLVAQMEKQANEQQRSRQGFGPAPQQTPPATPSATSLGGGDVLDKLERLQKLRDSGAVDSAEFERLKRSVIEAGT